MEDSSSEDLDNDFPAPMVVCKINNACTIQKPNSAFLLPRISNRIFCLSTVPIDQQALIAGIFYSGGSYFSASKFASGSFMSREVTANIQPDQSAPLPWTQQKWPEIYFVLDPNRLKLSPNLFPPTPPGQTCFAERFCSDAIITEIGDFLCNDSCLDPIFPSGTLLCSFLKPTNLHTYATIIRQ